MPTPELKRYFRDRRWAFHVDRQVQELVLAARDATEPLAQQLGRTPVDSDLARHLGVSGDKLRLARQLAFAPSSLDAPQGDHDAVITLADSLGEEDRPQAGQEAGFGPPPDHDHGLRRADRVARLTVPSGRRW